jgi:hypothetical protein
MVSNINRVINVLGNVDDTRFEKLLDRLYPYVSEENKIQLFIDNGGLEAIEVCLCSL